MSDSRIVVTGAAGQLGSELCRQLGSRALPCPRGVCDLTDHHALAGWLQTVAPTAIINSAAYTQVDRAEDDAANCHAVNAEAVANLARIARELDIPLVQVSTDYVFGADLSRATPYVEADPTGPLGVYAASKLEGEQRAALAPRHFIVRTCGLYSTPADQPIRGRNFVDTMLVLGRDRPQLRVVNDQHCTPSFVPHVAQAILQLLATEQYGVYHVVNAGSTTWCEFAREIFRLAGLPVQVEPITTAEYPTRAKRPGYSVLNTDKYRALTGAALPDWRSALAEYFSGMTDRAATVTRSAS